MTTTTASPKNRVEEVRAGFERDWAFLPLDGKRPIQKGWSQKARPRLEQCVAWAKQGNVGLRTGVISNLVVVDLDEGCDTTGMDLPPTVTVVTGSGGRHLYYQAPDVSIPNSAGKLGPHIDTRGEGGQVVFVGSVHPETGEVYRWAEGHSPNDVAMARLPQWIVDRLVRPARGESVNGCTPYGLAALERELDVLRATPEGARNTELNRAAFVLGQLIAGGELDGPRVQADLLAATDLPADEATRTIASGLRAGMQEPRSAPGAADATPSKTGRRHTVLVPGQHLDDKENYWEVSEAEFSRQVLQHLPPGRLYRRGEPAICGELLGDRGRRYFSPVEIDRLRGLASDHVRLIKWMRKKGGGPSTQKVCDVTRPLAGLIREEARASALVRQLELVVPFPAHGCEPGWNPNGVFYDQAKELEGLGPNPDPEVISATLDDLLTDFPFQDEASRQNFIGLMLTLLLRPTIDGNIPLTLVVSSLERTGKTKLIEDLLGGVLLGYPTPALQLSGGEEETDKRLLGMLLKGKPTYHFDNLRMDVDSGSLASVITASNYQGRALGTNTMPELRNRAVLVGSGNNVRMSSEMAKRTVPIILQPTSDSPELRADFLHPDLRAYVRQMRSQALSCLLGMVANWEKAGRPKGEHRLGGFESFTAVVGGVMDVQGYTQWLGNLSRWRRHADPHGEDLAAFVDAWWKKHRSTPVTAGELLSLADDLGVFLSEVRGNTQRGRLGSFSKRILARHRDTPVSDLTIRQSSRTSDARLWRLERSSITDDPPGGR